MIVGVDAGNYATKVSGPLGHRSYLSALGEWRDRRLKQVHGDDDIEFEYNGRRGFAGTLALYESEFAGSMLGSSKAHEDTLLRILIALHRYGGSDYEIVTGSPIDRHTEDEKQRITRMVQGKHLITVNGVEKQIRVRECRVAPEGGAAYWSAPVKGLIRIVDMGSGTVNLATLMDGRYVDRDSFTLRVGSESTKSKDLPALVRIIVTNTSGKWDSQDELRVAGGVAEQALPLIRKHYVGAKLLQPMGSLSPSMGNAVGFYAIAQRVFGK